MPHDVARAVLKNSARTKKKWLGLLSRNALMWPLGNVDAISTLQDATLRDFQSLLEAVSFRSWVQMHEPHTRALHSEGICGFISALSYFATGEMALFEVLEKSKRLEREAIIEARRRWRFYGQREMDSQCIGCERICALVRYPEGSAGSRPDALPMWDLSAMGEAALRRRNPG